METQPPAPMNPPGIRLGAAPTIRVANKAIIIREGRLLVTVNTGDFATFYLCPGGGQDHGESAVEGLLRECREELGCEVVVGDVAFIRDYIGSDHEFSEHDSWVHQQETYFFCTLAPGAEPHVTDHGDQFQTGVAWVPLEAARDAPLWPRALAGWLAADPDTRPTYLGRVN